MALASSAAAAAAASGGAVADAAEEEEAEEGGAREGPPQVVRVRRDVLAACMRCPLCHKLLRDATTISECLHTFCRKCIYEKLTDEEADCCPICNIDLGCIPLEKLRPDHSLQDLRAKIFPFKKRKVEALEAVPSFSLPVRRKERSLSSLVVNTPRIARRSGFTGRRTKVIARRAASLRRRSPVIDESVEKDNVDADGPTRNASSPETLTKMAQNRRQSTSSADASNHHPLDKSTQNVGECFPDKAELWKPLNCLVEAANRTKALKSSPQSPVIKEEVNNDSGGEIHVHKTKFREHPSKSKVQDDKNGSASTTPAVVKARKNGISRKRKGRGTSAQALVNAACAKHDRTGPIWFSLVPAFNQQGDAPFPQISSCYLRIKDGKLPVSFIQKYLVKKLNLASEAEVELTCKGQAVSPTQALHSLVDLWLQAGTSERVQATVGTSAKDFVMVLSYGRKVSAP